MMCVALSYRLIETARDDLVPSCEITAEPYLFVLQAATAKQVNFSYMIDCVLWMGSCIMAGVFDLFAIDFKDLFNLAAHFTIVVNF